jgi:hypothetical protein
MLADSEKKLQASIDSSAKAVKSELKTMEGRISRMERPKAGSSQGAAPAAAPARKAPAAGSSAAPAGEDDFIEEDL